MASHGQGYGPRFVYQEGAYFKRYLSAFLISVFTGFLVLLINSPFRHVIRRMLLKPGEGPSEKTMINGYFKCLLVAEAEDGERRIFSMYAKGDPGYRLTSKFICESAMLLAGDIEKLPGGKAYGGVLTPATALGQSMIDRLLKRDVHFE